MSRAPSAVLALAAAFLAAAPASAQTMTALGETITVDFAGEAPGTPYASPESHAVYLHVSVSERQITVRRGGEVLHRFPVGVGKGGTLRRLDGTAWEWDTPTGIFEVGRKKEDPVWYRPDWYYAEKGLTVPPAYSDERYARGMLGDYALYISDEIAIHGTSDESSVGRASSHGCLRMLNEDVAIVFALVDIGTKVIVTP
ncbi:MAG: L,D-transpeptidase [Gemmatimonadetes bacterium]|nr:L,D-transpeptidase [Gemmatimonadota bacterium]